MTKKDKVAHLVKGVTEDVFNLLCVKKVDLIEGVLRSSQHIKTLQSNRVTSPKLEQCSCHCKLH